MKQDSEGYHVTTTSQKLEPEYTNVAKEDAYNTWYEHFMNCNNCNEEDECSVAQRLWKRFGHK